MRIIKLLFIFAITCVSTSVFAAKVTEYTLPNGLKLFVKPDHRAPVVVSMVWYKVGAAQEALGHTGISHVLEHMMFRGTQKYSSGEFSRIISENGGQENAFTNSDYTAYYQELATDRLPISFELEADRMQNLVVNKEIFEKEIKVVREERRLRIEDNPRALTYERFKAAALIDSPYQHPTIGWMNDIMNISSKEIESWYKTWYAPNNAIVVVVGDVKPEQVLTLATQYFGPLKAQPIPRIKPFNEVPPMGLRQVEVQAPAKLPWLITGYNVPVLKTAKEKWQPYALAVLAAILDNGNSSRLVTDLVRDKQIANSVSAHYELFSYFPSTFNLSGTPTKNHTIDELKIAFAEEIKKLQTQTVSSQELARVKAQVQADQIYQKDSLLDQATEIGALESLGLSWQIGDDFVKNIQAVTAEQVQQVAKEYLNDNRMTIAILKPLPMQSNKSEENSTPITGGNHVR